jgi:SAM-dependent methyltransferase
MERDFSTALYRESFSPSSRHRMVEGRLMHPGIMTSCEHCILFMHVAHFLPYALSLDISPASLPLITSPATGEFNEVLFSPSLTTDEEFVASLEYYAKHHRAVTHHLLANLASASFGKKETADMLLMFLSAYRNFNSGFVDIVETLIGLLDNEGHVETLGENLREEMGEYDDETLMACEAMGIRRESIAGVPHRELFRGLLEFVETVLQRSYSRFIPPNICEKLNFAIDYARECGRLGLLSVLYFGSELIVPYIYSSILQGLRNSINVTNEDAKFLILHIDMDQDHARALREIIVENCRTKADRLVLAQCTKMMLDARVTFCDLLIRYTSLDPMSGGLGSKDEIAVHSESHPVCISDFTGRPVVIEMCQDHVQGSMILDVGCGTGHLARSFVSQGAAKIVGVDINGTNVEAANSHPDKNQHVEYYVEGDATNLKATLLKTTKQTNLMPGAQFDVGLFDLSVAAFVFNHLTITDMDKIFKNVFSLLKPGGYFVFAVPHPFMSIHGKAARQKSPLYKQHYQKSNSNLSYFQVQEASLKMD